MTEPSDASPAPRRRPRWRRVMRFGLRFGVSLAVVGVLVFASLLALWRHVPPVSTLMAARWATLRPVEREWTPLERISPHLVAAVISSEDARFCRHHGVDWGELRAQLASGDGPSRGASTIAMQTAKNLFLWPHRSYLRKGLEIPMALTIDAVWPKRRVIEVYLNIAEWGEDGLFGIGAASRRYFNKSPAQLTRNEAALLATSLPNPRLRNPAKPRRHHLRVARIVSTRASAAGPWLDCLR